MAKAWSNEEVVERWTSLYKVPLIIQRWQKQEVKSQSLLDEQALLSCMAYVDLNPIRADMAQPLEESEFTSIYERKHSVCSVGDKGNCQLSALPLKGYLVFLVGKERGNLVMV